MGGTSNLSLCPSATPIHATTPTETQTTDILVLLETEGLIDQNALDAETQVFIGEIGFLQGEGDRSES